MHWYYIPVKQVKPDWFDWNETIFCCNEFFLQHIEERSVTYLVSIVLFPTQLIFLIFS